MQLFLLLHVDSAYETRRRLLLSWLLQHSKNLLCVRSGPQPGAGAGGLWRVAACGSRKRAPGRRRAGCTPADSCHAGWAAGALVQ